MAGNFCTEQVAGSVFRCRNTGSSSPRAPGTEVQLPLVGPAQISPADSPSPSFLGSLHPAGLSAFSGALGWVPPAHQVQPMNYSCTLWWLDWATALPKSHFSFLLIRDTHTPTKHCNLHALTARWGELKVMFTGIHCTLWLPCIGW